MRVGIIGAGAAGLAAAYELGKHGHKVTVYEQAPFIGGQASTFDVGGTRLERGYHHLFTGDVDMINLVHEIGLGHNLRYLKSSVGTLYDGKIYDFVTPTDLLRFKPLSLINRIRLGLVTLMLGHKSDWQTLENFTASEWLTKYAGKRCYDIFWGPMLRGKFGEDYFDQLGMAWIWGKIHTRFASRGKGMTKEMLIYPVGSFGNVFDALAQKITNVGNKVYTSASVERVLVENGRARGMEIYISPNTKSAEEFDAVIATTPSHILPRLLPSLPENYLIKLNRVHYMSAVMLILVLNRPLSHVYWLNVADRSIPFVGVIEHTNLIGPEHYAGNHIVYFSNYLTTQHALYNMDHAELLQEYLPHIRKINPDFDQSWIVASYHHKVDAAQPIIGVNYSSLIPEHRTPIKGVYLANTTQVYPEDRGTNYSVRMGKQVAGMVIEDLAG